MDRYYTENLSAERLRRCYSLASPRVRRYLRAEIGFVLERMSRGTVLLELGCGYGRALGPMARSAGRSVGIDTSAASLRMATARLRGERSCHLVLADAGRLPFAGASFDLVVCIQNGVSALDVEPQRLIDEALRVTRRGGRVLLSSYAERFWDDRLRWFRAQAARGLIGEIDEEKTRDGVIVCRDGFRATTAGPREFAEWLAGRGLAWRTTEVDGSSLFCEIERGAPGAEGGDDAEREA
jgi:2-polyprenyl-6-hydroxyphenyl methylase/3-demethylubiquinone-9 3-methyltransferase